VSGTYSAARSSGFKPGFTQAFWNWASKTNDLNPQSWDKNALSAQEELMDILGQDGWERTEFKSQNWWQHTFRRPARTEDRGWYWWESIQINGVYRICDPEAKDSDVGSEDLKSGRIIKYDSQYWFDEQFVIEQMKEQGYAVYSIVPTGRPDKAQHRVTLRAVSADQ
jgi:hypothetical protein